MATNSKLTKIGSVVVENGKYIDKDGNEKKRWHEIGILFATPHHSRMCIKLHSNGFGEGQFCKIFYDKGKEPNFKDSMPDGGKAVDVVIPPEEIPF